VKAISNPSRDWRSASSPRTSADIHDLHLKLGPHVARAKLVRPRPHGQSAMGRAGEEYNRIGSGAVFGTKLRGDIDGRPVTRRLTS